MSDGSHEDVDKLLPEAPGTGGGVILEHEGCTEMVRTSRGRLCARSPAGVGHVAVRSSCSVILFVLAGPAGNPIRNGRHGVRPFVRRQCRSWLRDGAQCGRGS